MQTWSQRFSARSQRLVELSPLPHETERSESALFGVIRIHAHSYVICFNRIIIHVSFCRDAEVRTSYLFSPCMAPSHFKPSLTFSVTSCALHCIPNTRGIFLSANDYFFLPRRWGAHVVSSLCLAWPAKKFQNLSPGPVHGHVKSLQPQKK